MDITPKLQALRAAIAKEKRRPIPNREQVWALMRELNQLYRSVTRESFTLRRQGPKPKESWQYMTTKAKVVRALHLGAEMYSWKERGRTESTVLVQDGEVLFDVSKEMTGRLWQAGILDTEQNASGGTSYQLSAETKRFRCTEPHQWVATERYLVESGPQQRVFVCGVCGCTTAAALGDKPK